MDNPDFKIVEITGKGYGAISTSRIKRGTRIITESPLFTVPIKFGDELTPDSPISRQLKALSKEDESKFFKLHNNYVNLAPTPFGICSTNTMPLGSKADYCGIFLQCSRFNHSCDSNATYAWNEFTQKECIYAIKDIPPG